jgi:hypothetical protein
MCACLVIMRFAAACYLLALIVEKNIRSYGSAHVLDNTSLVSLLKNSHFYIVVVDDHVQSFFLYVVFGGVGVCIALVHCALLRFYASVDYLPVVLICKSCT